MDAGRAAAATLFIVSGTNAMDVYSATNSSPWTAFKFANDEESIEALRRYVRHAIVVTALINGGGAIIARSWWPVIGAVLAAGYMWWLYEDAVKRGKAAGTQSWEAQAGVQVQHGQGPSWEGAVGGELAQQFGQEAAAIFGLAA